MPKIKETVNFSIFPAALIVSSLVLFVSSLYNYLLFHTLIEVFSAVIAFGVFVIAWSSRKYINNNFLIILGIGYFFVGSFDLIHALSYSGVNIFSGTTSNLPTQLWIAARYFEALTFFGAFLFLIKKRKYSVEQAKKKAGMIFLGYAVVFIFLMFTIFYWKNFPAAYVEGTGLTLFKRVSEYIISAIFLVAIVLLFKKQKMLDSKMANLLSLALMIKIFAELSFTGYVGVYDFANMLGHLFKFISFALIYKAVLEVGLMEPYRFMFLDLKRSEMKYRSLFDNMIDGHAIHKMIFDQDGKPVDYVFQEVNEAYGKLTGLKRNEIIGKTVTEVIPDIVNDSTDWIGKYGQVVLTGQPVKFDSFSQTLKRWYSVVAYKPEPGIFAVVFEDVTEAKEAELELQKLSQQRQLALDAAKMGWWHYDPKKKIYSWDDRSKEVFGFEENLCFANDFLGRIHPNDLSAVNEKMNRALSSENPQPYFAQYRINYSNEAIRWVETHGLALFEKRGEKREAVSFVGTVTDITERINLNEKLKENMQKYRKIVKYAPAAIYEIDMDEMKFLNVNETMSEILGYSEQELLSMNPADLLEGEEKKKFLDRMEAILSGKKVKKDPEFKVRAKDGTIIDAILNIKIIYEGGKPSKIFVVAHDITERKKAEEDLRKAEKDLKLAQAVSHTGSWRLDIPKNELYWSEENHRIFGIPEGTQMNYETFLMKVHPDDRKMVDSSWKASMEGRGSYDLEHRIIVNEKVKWVREKAFLEFGKENSLQGGFGITQDITELKTAQEKQLRAEEELRKRTEEHLAEAYEHLGVTNRKISLLLEMEQHSIKDKNKEKNKKQIVENVVEIAKSASRAKVALLHKYNGNKTFSLINEKDIAGKQAEAFKEISIERAKFLEELMKKKKRVNAACGLKDPGWFNFGKKLSYFVVLPFIHENSCCGFLFLGFENRKTLETQELEFLDVFAMHASNALVKVGVLKKG